MRNKDLLAEKDVYPSPVADFWEGAGNRLNYKKVLSVFLAGWYYIAISLLLCLAAAFWQIRSSPRQYATSAVIRVEDEKNGLSFDAVAPIRLYRPRVDLESEIFVIRSREVMENAVKRVNYQVSYYIKGAARLTNVYPETPVSLVLLDSVAYSSDFFELEQTSQNSFLLTYQDRTASYDFNEPVRIDGYKFKVQKGPKPLRDRMVFRINTAQSFASSLRSSLSLAPYSKNSNILNLSINYANPQFAADLLNAVMDEYIANSARSKQRAASQTIAFLEEQLQLLSLRLRQSESDLENYKKNKGIINLATNTSMLSDRLSEQEAQKMQLKLQSLSIAQLEEQLKQNSAKVSLNLGLEIESSSGLGTLLTQFNSLVNERNTLLQQFNERSSNIAQIDRQISAIREAAANNIRLLRDRNNKTQKLVDEQIAVLQNALKNIPGAERELFSLTTANEINQKVYSFLNEKKLSAQITRASTVSDAYIVERAVPNFSPISPIPLEVYKKYGLFGLLLGIGIILVLRQLYPFITDRDYVEAQSNIPILGVIRKFPERVDENNTQVLHNISPKSVFAESIRSVRTNLSFFAAEKDSKVICVTSEVAGEGKSFTSLNLAATLSLIEKRVILVAADLRRSKLHKTFGLKFKTGLSEYLSAQATLEDVIVKTDLGNLDFISSGTVPPNPSELLHSQKMQLLINLLSQQYDYVIIDTAPVGLISDAIPLLKKADINLFVIRAGVSRFSAASLPARIATELGLSNLSIILNEFEYRPLFASFYSQQQSNAGYYGYYYYSDYSAYSSYLDDLKPNRWQRFFKRFKL